MPEKLMDFDRALELFEPVLGFEVHVELNTHTKMFSSAPNNFGAEPNTNVTPTCLGLPGSLPVVNEKAVHYAISLGLALECSIAASSSFARKNYFYPDVPKNYQISQSDEPIAFDGRLQVELASGRVCVIDIERAHIEEDAGKLTHVGGSTGRIHGAEFSLVDYNRAGVPLVEIVTRPIFGAESDAGELAKNYVAGIRDIVLALGISDAKMERGNLRCDANVSLRPRGEQKLGTRTETKNVNSLRSIERAVRYEIQRQAAILSEGGTILQETRHWQEDSGTTRSGRVKSDADDYRYFPEPDLAPIEPSHELIESLRSSLPELPRVTRARFKSEWGFSDRQFQDIINADLLPVVAETIDSGATPAAARKWWMGELLKIANAKAQNPAEVVPVAFVVELSKRVDSGELTDRLARDVIEGYVAGEGTIAEVIASRGLVLLSDESELVSAIDRALNGNADIVTKIREGKVQAAGALVGVVMKELGGKADAARVKELILSMAESTG